VLKNSFFLKVPLSVTCARVYRIKCTTYVLCTDSSSKSVSFLEFTTASSTCPSYSTSQVARNILTSSIVWKWRTVSARVLVFTRLDDLHDGHVKR